MWYVNLSCFRYIIHYYYNTKKNHLTINDLILSELPTNTCVYEYEWIASTEGGERKRSENERTVALKQVHFASNINVKHSI